MPTNEEVTALTTHVSNLTRAVQEEKEAKRTSNRRLRLVIALIVLVGGYGFWQNNDRIDQIIEVRSGSRVVSCIDRRAIAEAHNTLVFGIVTRDFTRPVPDELAAGVRRQLVPVPDCSTQKAVEDFYGGKTTPTKPEFPAIPLTGAQSRVTAGETTPPVRAEIDQ